MCLYTEQTEPKTAKHNIFVWKEISNQKCGNKYKWIPPIFSSAGELDYNKILIPKNLNNQEDIKALHILSDCNDFNHGIIYYYVNEGFHAHIKKPRGYFNTSYKIAVIPKSSEYCLGVYRDIVASRMIVFRTWWDYLTWKLKIIIRTIKRYLLKIWR